MSKPAARPRISVIVPAYNAQAALGRCLDSIERQTLRAIEAIVVDDGSADATARVASGHAAADARVRAIRQENAGVSAARNAGLAVARGDVAMFVDADDWIDADACERVLGVFGATGAEVVVFGARCEPESAATAHTREVLSPRDATFDGFSPELLFSANAQPYACRMGVSRALLERERIAFPEGLSLAEDAVFQFLAYPLSRRTVLISDKPYHYAMDEGSAVHEHNAAGPGRKVEQHLRAIEEILSQWSRRGLLGLCPADMVQWCLDFTLFDIARMEGLARAQSLARLDSALEEAYGEGYAALPRKAAVRRMAAAVRGCRRGNDGVDDAACAFDGAAGKLSLVRFFVATRGLRQCIERFV